MKIPTYQNTNGIKVGNTPELNLASVKSSERAQEGLSQAIANVGKNFAEVEEARGKIRDFRQTAESSVLGIQRTNDVLNLWEDNPEDLEPEKYYTELDKIGPEITKNISNQIAKEQFMADFSKQIESAKFKIRSSYNKREVSVLQGTIELGNQNIIDNPPEDLHDPLHNTILLNHRKSYDKAIAVGLYTRDEAQYKWNDFLKKLSIGKAGYEVQKDRSTTQDSSLILRELLKGKDGAYGNLPTEEIGKLIKDSKINIHRNKLNEERAILETNTQSSLDMAKGITDKTLTIATIDNLRNTERIDIETAGIFANALEKRNIEAPADNTTVDYMIKLLDKDSSTGFDILKEATRIRGTEGFDDTAYGYVVQEVAKKFDREKSGLNGWDKSTTAFRSALKGIQAFNETYNFTNPKVAGGMLLKLIERVSGGESPEKAKSGIIEEQLNTEIENTKLTLPPQTEKLVSPDGRVFEVKQENIDKALARGLKRANK